MTRNRKALYLFLGLAVVLALLAAKMVMQVRRGEELFWVAELWAPAAVLSIGVVTGLEFLMAPSRHPAPAAPTEAVPLKAVRRRKPAAKPVKKAKKAGR
jgi:hypothetical protein